MRILHTSDWHLGRSFHRVGLLDAQAAFLDDLVATVRSQRVDVVVVAGDVYDRALPAVDVVQLLDDALARLAGTGATIVLTSGNHDSARRLGFAARLLEPARVHVRTDPARCAEPVLLADDHGPVAIYPLPYLEPAVVAGALGCAPTHERVLAAAMAAVRADLAARRAALPGLRSVVAAHAFVIGGTPSDSERDIAVGGVGSVPAGLFDGVDYVALGHLHGRQAVNPAVRYSGSPLAYSFSEYRHVKGSWLVTLGPAGVAAVEPVAAPVPRPLAVLRGTLEQLLADPRLHPQERAWCQVTLTDDGRPAEAMARLRRRFPHVLELRFEPAAGPPGPGPAPQRLTGSDDLAVCCEFVRDVRGREATEVERTWLAQALLAQRLREAEERGVHVLPAARPGAQPEPAASGAAGAGRAWLEGVG